MTVKRKARLAKSKRYTKSRKSRSSGSSDALAALALLLGGVALASILSSRKLPTTQIKPGWYELNYTPSQRVKRAIAQTEQVVTRYAQ